MTAYRERIFSRPYRLDNLQAGILAMGVDSDQPAAGPQSAPQWCNNASGTEINARFGPIGLGSDDQVEIGLGPAGPRNDRIEQKPVVLPVKHQRHRPFIDRHARARGDAGPPVLLQKWAQFGNLGLEIAGSGPPQGNFVP